MARTGRREVDRRARAPAPSGIRVDVLGPVTVTVDGAQRPLTARRQRAVLACLALHPGEALSADRLLEEIWGDELPETGRAAVPFQIARLRSVLEPDRVGEGTLIVTSTAGYSLETDPEQVDALRFEQLVARARELLAPDPAGCEELVVEALELWRGHPFADLGAEPFVEPECRHLAQLHVLARRTLAEARIELGRAVEVIDDLERLVDELPFDESLVGLLMTALHRSGRAADALRAYGELRRRLSEELGIDPSDELQCLEFDLLSNGTRPPRHTSGRPPSVPAAVSSFVGRDQELAGIEHWLSVTRLVTICGFGGLGKTRLAQEIARRIDGFADGVWYVDLTRITDGTMLADSIIAAGGSRIPADRDPVDFLVSTLADREVLVVLDNCENLIDGVAVLVARILPSAPGVRVLATSRVSLGVEDESVWTLRPLDAASSLDLFLMRAQLARSGFVIDDSNRVAVEQLVGRLDGIPLAIEIAAARLAALGVVELDEYLDDRLLTRDGRDADRRQHSIHEVLDWSYHLLDEADRVLLRRLSVCVGGFDLDAVTAIGGTGPTPDRFDRLGRLAEASLVVFESGHDTARYRILEPIRDYALSKLDAHERTEVGLAHALHYEMVAAKAFDLASRDRSVEIRIGQRELGNLRAAISWAYLNDHPRLGLSIACRGRMWFLERLLDRELLEWLRTGLELVDEEDDHAVVLEAAATAVITASNVLDEVARDRYAQRVHRGLDGVADPTLRAELLSACASPLLETDPRAAEAYTNMAIELDSAYPWRKSAFLTNRIDQSWFSGILDDGEMLLRRFAEVWAVMLDPPPEQFKIEAGVAAGEGRWDDVVRIARSAHGLDARSEAGLGLLHAEALAALGRLDEARVVLDQLHPNSADSRRSAYLVGASIDLRRGDPGAAVERLERVDFGRAARELVFARGVQVTSLLAIAANDLGQPAVAAVLFGYSAVGQERLDIRLRASDRPLAAEAIESCRAELGAQRFDELAAKGASTEWNDLPRVEISER